MLGLMLASVHLLVFIICYIYINILNAGKEQIQLLWIYWLAIDFPVSLIVMFGFENDVPGSNENFNKCFKNTPACKRMLEKCPSCAIWPPGKPKIPQLGGK